jgi:hypothetical protein
MPRFTEEQLNGMALEIAKRMAPSIASHFRNSVSCCPNCENFDGGLERCKLNNMRPPATVIAFGCECFVDNELPF